MACHAEKCSFDFCLFFGLVAAVIVGFMVFLILDVPVTSVYALVSGALTFFLYSYLVAGNTSFGSKGVIIRSKSLGPIPLFVAFYVFLIASVALIQPVSNDFLLFTDWFSIPILNWIRLFAALLLTTFIPGYVILHVGKVRIGKIAFTVLSYLLSMFLVFLSVICALLLGVSIEQYGMALLLSFNFLLLILYIVTAYLRQGRLAEYQSPRQLNVGAVFTAKNMLLLSVVILILLLKFTSISYLFPFFGGDMTTHHGAALSFIKEGITSATYPIYPYLFHVYLASFFVLCGIPTINAYVILTFLVVMPYLALYAMASAFFKGKRIPAIATVVTLFGGLGWERILLMKSISFPGLAGMGPLIESKIGWGVSMLMWFPEELSPIFLIGIPSFLMLVFLSRFINMGKLTRSFLIMAVVVVGFMGHIVEIFVFAIILALLFFFSNRGLFEFRNTAISMTIGLLLVALLDMLAPASNFLSQTGGHFLVFSVTIFLSILVASLSLFERKLRFGLTMLSFGKHFKEKCKKSARAILVFLLVYLYGLCYLVWVQVDPLIDRSTTVDVNSVIFSYPLKMGVAGLISIGCVAYLLLHKRRKNEKRRFDFFLVLGFVSISLIMGTALIFPNASSLLRPPFYMMMVVSVLAAAGLVHLFSWLRTKLQFGRKQFLLSGLLSLIVISSIANPLLVYGEMFSVWTRGRHPVGTRTEDQRETFEFLSKNVPPDGTVGIFDSYSQYLIAGYTGINLARVDYVGLSATPALALQRLSECQVKYIVVDKSQGIPELCQDSFEARYLLSCLPIAFENGAYIIYEVPPLSYPTSSQLALVAPNETLVAENSLLDENMVLHLPFDGNSDLVVGSGFNGSSNFWVEGKYGEAGQFDGVDDYFYLAEPNVTTLSSEQGSISLWFKPTWDVYSYAGAAILYGDAGTHDNSFRLYFDPGGYLHFYIMKNGTLNLNMWTTQKFWEKDTWYNVVITQDMANARIYVNGKEDTFVDTNLGHWLEGIALTKFWVCRMQANYQKGILDDLKIYNRTLSAKDVLRSFDSAEFTFNDLYIPSLSMLALSGYRYDVTWSDEALDYSSLVLPYDISNNFSVANYLDWVEGGGNLIVLNSLGHESFSKVMSIYENGHISANTVLSVSSVRLPSMLVSQVYVERNDTQTIANYCSDSDIVSPFAFQRAVGQGSITYVEMEPIISIFLERNSTREVWRNLGSLIKLLNLEFLSPLTELPPSHPNFFFDFFRGTANFTGDVRIDSPSFLLPNPQSLHVKQLGFSNTLDYNYTNVQGDETEISSDLWINSVEILGGAQTTIFSSNVQIQPQSTYTERYITINLPTEFNWTMTLSSEAAIRLSCSKGNSSFQLTAQDGNINLTGVNAPQTNACNFSILLKAPLIQNKGKSYFDYLLLYKQHTSTEVVNNQVMIDGGINLQATLSGNGSSLSRFWQNPGAHPYTTFSFLEINGEVTPLYLTLRSGITRYQNEWYELPVPWHDILFSYSNAILLVVSAIGVVLMYVCLETRLEFASLNIFKKKQRKSSLSAP